MHTDSVKNTLVQKCVRLLLIALVNVWCWSPEPVLSKFVHSDALPPGVEDDIHYSHFEFGPPGPPSHEYSAFWCLGGRGRLGAQDDRSCLFQNLCYNSTLNEWVFYRNKLEAHFPILNDNGRIISEFPKEFVNLRTLGFSKDSQHWSPKILYDKIPSSKNHYPSNQNHNLAVLYHPHYPSNMGHTLGDDLFPIFNLLTSFGSLDRHIQLITHRSCADIYSNSPGRVSTCQRFQESLLRGISTQPVRSANSHEFVSQLGADGDLVCFERLAAGIGPFGFQQSLGKAFAWREFHHYYLANMGINPHHTPSQHRILVSKKSGENVKRDLANHDELVLHLTRSFPDIQVMEVDFKSLNSWKKELEILSDTTVMITPCGGVSMNAMFLPFGASLIVVDYYDPNKKNTVGMEDRLWSSLGYIRHFPYPFKKEEVELAPNLSPDNPADLRAYGRVRVDLPRMTTLVKAALSHVENFMIMGQD